MVKVKILCGGYGLPATSGTKLILRGQTVEGPEDEAKRLIALGLAAPVSAAPVNTANSADEGEPDPGQTPDTPDPDKEQEPEDKDPAADGAEIEGEEDEVDLSELTVAELKELCADAGIDLKGLTSKAKLIAAYEAQALPEITAEDPV